MKYSINDFDIFAQKVNYDTKIRNKKMNIIGFSLTVLAFSSFLLLLVIYFRTNFTKVSQKVEDVELYSDLMKSSNVPSFELIGNADRFIERRKEINFEFYNNKFQLLGNVGMINFGVMLVDTDNNNLIKLNEVSFTIYNNSENTFTKTTAFTYPCSTMLNKINSLYNTEFLISQYKILELYECFDIDIMIDKNLNELSFYFLYNNTSPNFEITIQNNRNILLNIFQFDIDYLSRTHPQINPKFTSHFIPKNYPLIVDLYYQSIYYKYFYLNLIRYFDIKPFDSFYHSVSIEYSNNKNDDTIKIKYHLIDTVKTINFYNTSLFINYSVYGNLLFLFYLIGRTIYNAIPINFSLLPIIKKICILIPEKKEKEVELISRKIENFNDNEETNNEVLIEMTENNKYNEDQPVLNKIQQLQEKKAINDKNNKIKINKYKRRIINLRENIRSLEQILYHQIIRFNSIKDSDVIIESNDKELVNKGITLTYTLTDISEFINSCKRLKILLSQTLSKNSFVLFNHLNKRIIKGKVINNELSSLKQKSNFKSSDIIFSSIKRYREIKQFREYDKKILISFKNYAQSNLVEELIELLNKYYRLIAFENDI